MTMPMMTRDQTRKREHREFLTELDAEVWRAARAEHDYHRVEHSCMFLTMTAADQPDRTLPIVFSLEIASPMLYQAVEVNTLLT